MNRSSPVASIVEILIYLLIGPLVWAAHLMVIYSTTTLICALGQRSNWGAAGTVSAVVIAATAVALAIVAVSTARPRQARSLLGVKNTSDSMTAFLDRAMRILGALSLVAIFWAGATVIVVTPCVQLR